MWQMAYVPEAGRRVDSIAIPAHIALKGAGLVRHKWGCGLLGLNLCSAPATPSRTDCLETHDCVKVPG
jgi:hypothetical protein